MGPHVPATGKIKGFKVMSVAASNWHGDVNSDRFQRVYGTAFFDKKQLDEHLKMLEEAKKRDHRVLGPQLGLFAIDDAVGQGLVLWKPKGAVVRQELQNFISEHLRRQGYHQVFTPHIGRLGLYKTSGHYPYYRESQFPPLVDRELIDQLANEKCDCGKLSSLMEKGEVDGYLLKPMNCPMHIKIFSSEQRSYRDMPVRLAEFGTVYRWEKSGELGGMTRVRGFTQDDAHLFCTEEQVPAEVQGCLELVKIVLGTLGMDNYRVRVGLRDPDSNKYVGDASQWDRAEAACIQAAETLGVPFTKEPGEAAFYGPKIDFVVKDVIGREWQLGTVQVDYQLPQRFELEYIGPDNAPHRPVMIHRAPFGVDGAFHRRADRAFRRRVPALARAGAGRGHDHQRKIPRLRPRRHRSPQIRRPARRTALRPGKDRREDPRRQHGKNPVPADRRRAGSAGRQGRRPHPAQRREARPGRDAAGGVHQPRRTGDRHPRRDPGDRAPRHRHRRPQRRRHSRSDDRRCA